MKKLAISMVIMSFLVALSGISQPSSTKNFAPGMVWTDITGKPINAHGGGILYHDGIYYWFGEIKNGKTWRVPYITSWECYRTDAGGVSCYLSKNLLDWKFEGVALQPNKTDKSSDIHFSKVIERPKVIYNEKTKKFVMWMHIDSEDYAYARAGVAVSDKPEGPYTYQGSVRPNNQMSRDMTLFKDDDGKAYQIFSSENNATMHISLLTDDYLKPTGTEKRIFIDKSREAPAMFKCNNKYYLITSGCTGWDSNAASYAVASSMLGEWEMIGNPCIGEGSDQTFTSQSTYVLPVHGKPNLFIFMADRWDKTNLEDSRYIWLPLQMTGDKPEIKWLDKWRLETIK